MQKMMKVSNEVVRRRQKRGMQRRLRGRVAGALCLTYSPLQGNGHEGNDVRPRLAQGCRV
eukprot:749355-Hanusia_phi.AAC.2